ncbi:MAG: hypothetical protein JXA14_19640 [Anaerolineae bacterium]|nr:hypothetical protein [Anaerolineae bacterium]
MYQYPQQQPIYYPQQQYSGCLKWFLYILSFVSPFPVGIIIAIVFLSRPDPESKSLGNTCLIVSIISMVVYCCVTVAIILFSGALPMLMIPFMDVQ